jgi:putative ABC transport system permease protein
MQGDSELPFWLEGEPKPASEQEMKVSLFYITQPDYLQVMKIPLKRGRFLTDSDTENSSPIVVIDERFAKQFFGDKNPIGSHINFDILNMNVEIVGIVGHVKQWGLDSDGIDHIQAQCYFPLAQIPDSLMSLLDHGTGVVVRTQDAPIAAMASIGHAVQNVNSQVVIYGTQTMNDVIADSLAAKRFSMILLGVFAVVAIILSSLGIYGVISYLVGQRTHEIGIRMALGAERSTVVRMVLAEAGKMVLFGIAIGLIAAFALTRLISTMLFGISSHDPLTFIAVAATLSLVALAACWLPARRASLLDPMRALRYE